MAVHSVSHHHRPSDWQRTERWLAYGDTGMTEVNWATGSIYLGDPGVNRCHRILSSYNEIHTLCVLTSDLTRLFCNFVDPHGWVVSHLLTLFPPSSNPGHCFSRIALGFCERCSGVLMMRSLPSSSAVRPHRPAGNWIRLRAASWPP